MQYADGLKIDLRLWPVALTRRIAQAPELPADLDVGYTVLVDKDRLFDEMRPPTYTAYVLERPDEETYLAVINNFFSDASYVAKCLWRDELMPAKRCLAVEMRHHYLRPMLEWRMERDHGWSTPTGNLGKGLKKRLPPEIWRGSESTYVGSGIADNREALFRTMALFRRVAIGASRRTCVPQRIWIAAHDGVTDVEARAVRPGRVATGNAPEHCGVCALG